ncbi:hypothetical protein AB0C27_49080 [Nonomuraea sp. NPDC048882]|uniref:hypothetical protein n=1 Tax=Nonomuraea sp. NPDC048882 TaxID=3154347 RepID=UPI0033DBE137
MFVAPGGRVQGVVDALFERAYEIWPSYGPAVVLAPLVISVFLGPPGPSCSTCSPCCSSPPA